MRPRAARATAIRTDAFQRPAAPWLAFAAVVALTVLAYWPALGGGYLLDDWPSLIGLEKVRAEGGIAFWRFVLEGFTGPTGRPVALLSFAWQAGAWPDDPAAFHAVNLTLHLACGVALALLGRLIARHWWPAAPRTADWIAVAAAALWLLHPLNVSTTAYIVQRMTQLATLFTLLALLAWCHGRARLERDPADRRAPWLAAAGLVSGGLAAVFSKETGVLLLAYALVLEHWVFRRDPPALWRRLRLALLVAPALLFVALVAWRFESLVGRALWIRDFTLWERLLSEPRALLVYLKLIVAPLPSELSLFNDAFPVSRGLLEPATTLPALALVLAGAALAVAWRRRAPLAFAGAWFLAGHLLESTVLPLELYFEHRNYLPMAGVLLVAAHGLAVALARVPTPRARGLLVAGALGVVATFGAITRAEARLWSDPGRLIATWAQEHPGSTRALGHLLAHLKDSGDLAAAARGFEQATARFPDHPGMWLDWVELGCRAPDAPRPPAATVADALATARPDYSALAALVQMVDKVEDHGRCGAIRPLELAIYLGALMANPRYERFLPSLHLMRARLAVVVGDHAGAGADFDRAYALSPETDVALIRFYGALKSRDGARMRRTLTDVERSAARDRLHGWLYADELARWDQRLREAGVPRDAAPH